MSALSRLSAAGVDPQLLSDDQRSVLATLSTEEIDTLVKIKHRFDGAEGDLEAHSETDGKNNGHVGVIFW